MPRRPKKSEGIKLASQGVCESGRAAGSPENRILCPAAPKCHLEVTRNAGVRATRNGLQKLVPRWCQRKLANLLAFAGYRRVCLELPICRSACPMRFPESSPTSHLLRFAFSEFRLWRNFPPESNWRLIPYFSKLKKIAMPVQAAVSIAPKVATV